MPSCMTSMRSMGSLPIGACVRWFGRCAVHHNWKSPDLGHPHRHGVATCGGCRGAVQYCVMVVGPDTACCAAATN